jgi:alpha-tubulin suppressor-like RCC1 family protein
MYRTKYGHYFATTIGRSAGSSHSCGVRTNGTLACWGENGDGQATPPAGTLRSVSAGGFGYTCAIKTNNTLACWGNNDYGQTTPPAGFR